MKIIHKRLDGGVSITHLCSQLSLEDATKHAEELQQANSESFISYRIIEDDSLLPSDRTFRDAWTDNNSTETVDVDISKAQEIKKQELRNLRQPLLEALDIEYIRAIETGSDPAEIVNKKQELRDVTLIDLPTNVEKLKSFIPDCLKD